MIRRFKVEDRSMEPTIHSGEFVIVRKYFLKPKVGDIIVFERNGIKLIKRIIKIENGKYLVRGDNKNSSEFEVDSGYIIGKVWLR